MKRDLSPMLGRMTDDPERRWLAEVYQRGARQLTVRLPASFTRKRTV